MEKVENITYKSIGKKAIGCMRLTSTIANLVIFAVFAIALLIMATEGVITSNLAIIFGAIILFLCVIYIILAPIIRYKRYKYYVDDDMLVVVEGLFFIKKSIAPIERIHQIELRRGPIDRMFDMSNVVVTTAGGVVKIAFLDTEVAEEIANKLKKRINGIVKAEKGDLLDVDESIESTEQVNA